MSMAADLFMLELIAQENENALNVRLPKFLINVYKDIVSSAQANAYFVEEDTKLFINRSSYVTVADRV